MVMAETEAKQVITPSMLWVMKASSGRRLCLNPFEGTYHNHIFGIVLSYIGSMFPAYSLYK